MHDFGANVELFLQSQLRTQCNLLLWPLGIKGLHWYTSKERQCTDLDELTCLAPDIR